jgi:hypothetical protein
MGSKQRHRRERQAGVQQEQQQGELEQQQHVQAEQQHNSQQAPPLVDPDLCRAHVQALRSTLANISAVLKMNDLLTHPDIEQQAAEAYAAAGVAPVLAVVLRVHTSGTLSPLSRSIALGLIGAITAVAQAVPATHADLQAAGACEGLTSALRA